ncbi:MAG: tryptophan synthase subunit alpha [Actinomycetota bacterium]|nr:tryptophan synthase subunit alpha [Actinomycetota bacterium]
MIKDNINKTNGNMKTARAVLDKTKTYSNRKDTDCKNMDYKDTDHMDMKKINPNKTAKVNIDKDRDTVIKRKFEELKTLRQKGFIPFVTCGYPNLEDFIKLVCALDKNGADIIEIGIPFSDPLADGPVIQATSKNALDRGMNTDKVFNSVVEIRSKSNIPIVLMTYFNIVYRYGIEKFLHEAAVSGVNGLIIPDLPLEEFRNYEDYFKDGALDNILLASLTSGENRLKQISSLSKGFLYCVSVKGVTGVRNTVSLEVIEFLKKIRKFTDIPLALGFGISTIEQINKTKAYCDAIVMGSKILSVLLSSDTFKKGLKSIESLVYSTSLSLKS